MASFTGDGEGLGTASSTSSHSSSSSTAVMSSGSANNGSFAAAFKFPVEKEICKSSVDGASFNTIGVSAIDFATDGMGSIGCRFVTRNCSCGAVNAMGARLRLDVPEIELFAKKPVFNASMPEDDADGSANVTPLLVDACLEFGPAKMNSRPSFAAMRLDIIGSSGSLLCITASICRFNFVPFKYVSSCNELKSCICPDARAKCSRLSAMRLSRIFIITSSRTEGGNALSTSGSIDSPSGTNMSNSSSSSSSSSSSYS
mmetsp:Transcript_7203/g.26329  ORF Transcript_7203/g.26329 Transcript_7203/m.26329 type:complete len:258 (+) Transcript_7203:2513-3286(+)